MAVNKGIKLLMTGMILFLAVGCKSNTWNAESLTEAQEVTDVDGISMEIIERTSSDITVEITNDTEEEWLFGEYYSIEILLDDVWYCAPLKADEVAFHDIGYIVEPHESREATYSLKVYEKLISGKYRIVVNDVYAKFEID